MNLWFTRPGAAISRTHVKRFDPIHWTVDFPRGAIASLVTSEDGHGLSIAAELLRKGDLVGLIWDSTDGAAHPAHARETARDYSHCVLSFHWQSSGVISLDAIDGPTLTIEGTDASGNPRSWFVRLWNYAVGAPESADITIDFDALDGGFGLADADRVDPTQIDRMFISLVAPGYVSQSATLFASPAAGSATLSNIRCDGSSSVLEIKDG
ncbi:MAG: TIGR02217 family protein, partial [Sphingomicrobium sp.]